MWNTAAMGQPSPRYRHTSIYDPAGQCMIVFGGTNGAGAFYSDTWRLSLTDSPAWTPLTPEGPTPPRRASHSAIYDPVRNRVLVFGGIGPNGGLVDLADVWSLSLSDTTWSQLQPSGEGPSARSSHSAIYDPVRDRMLIFG